MQKSIVWEGLLYDTEEHCSINYLDTSIIVRSEIEGWAGQKAVYADYVLTLNLDWTVREINIDFTTGTQQHSYCFTRHGSGQWTDSEGTLYRKFNDCCFVDISLTPFTNTLPLNGITFTNGQPEQIEVLYFDILNNEVRTDVQRYTKIDNLRYQFENDGGNFSAVIETDTDGFVTRYPNLYDMLKPL
jgi:hypothetical protein